MAEFHAELRAVAMNEDEDGDIYVVIINGLQVVVL